MFSNAQKFWISLFATWLGVTLTFLMVVAVYHLPPPPVEDTYEWPGGATVFLGILYSSCSLGSVMLAIGGLASTCYYANKDWARQDGSTTQAKPTTKELVLAEETAGPAGIPTPEAQ